MSVLVQKQYLLFALRGLNWDQNVRLPSYSSRLLFAGAGWLDRGNR